MTRLLLLTPFLAACAHAPTPCVPQWPYTCEDRGDGVQAVDVSQPAPTPVDDSNGADSADKPAEPKDDHSRDDNGGSSGGNSDDGNGGKSHDD